MEERTYPPMASKQTYPEADKPIIPRDRRQACHCRECRCKAREVNPSGIRCHEVPY